MGDSGEITTVLAAAREGDSQAAERLWSLVYDELKQIAGRQMVHERADHTLQTTALVHEAYLRLVGESGSVQLEDRRHFFGAAGEAMRRILVDHARTRSRRKRGGDQQKVTLVDHLVADGPPAEEILALDMALERLEEHDSEMAEVVKLRHFVGMTNREVAEVLGVSTRSVNRLWSAGRAWLSVALRARPGGGSAPDSE